MKKHLLALVSALVMTMPTMAQTDGPAPHAFFGLQGGISKDYIHSYKNWKPTASAYVGYMFTPVVGARLHVNGIWTNGFYDFNTVKRYDHKYLTGNVDALFNLCNANNREKLFPVNAYWITGIGVRHAWDADFPMDAMKWAANGRVGFALDVPICKYVSANAEVDMNNYIHRTQQHHLTDNVQFTAQLGLAFKFAYKAKPAPAEEWATRTDTIWYDEAVYTPRIENGEASWNVFYEIRESDFDAETQIRAIGNFLKDYHDCKITVKSYADRGTGNPRINMGYSQQRNEKAVKALLEAGVSESAITAEYFGDTVQPFAENDKNRVTIITATGLKDVKDKSLVKKSRTEEVRYRVQ